MNVVYVFEGASVQGSLLLSEKKQDENECSVEFGSTSLSKEPFQSYKKDENKSICRMADNCVPN